MLRSTGRSLKASARLISRTPGFAILTAVILALGIGATAGVFSLIQGALLTPPPYENPGRLVLISSVAAPDREGTANANWSAPQWEEWQAEARSLEAVAGYRWTFNFLILDDGSEPLEGMWISPAYFEVTGLEPQIGRSFHEGDATVETPGVIIGHELWQRRFGGDPAVLGQTIRLSRMPPLTVVGVMPPDVRFLPSPGVEQEPNYDLNGRVDFWQPMPTQLRERGIWDVVALLKPGATVADAQAELTVLAARQAEADPNLEGVTAELEALTSVLNQDGKRILWPLLVSAGLVLLISCGNAAALLLVRGLQRQHEYGLRSAVGAGRGALFRHVIAESLALSLLGGALGVLLALGIVGVFKTIGGNAIPRLDAVTTGWPLLAFGVGTAVAACLLAGFVPALRASKLNPVDALRLGGTKASAGPGQRGLLGGVVIVQTALTLALLVSAGLLIRTMQKLDAVEAGYDTSNVITMSVTAVQGDWADFHERAIERVAALPGVEGVAFSWGVPLTGNNWPTSVEIEGVSLDDPRLRIPIAMRAATTGYFELLGQTMTEGRDFRRSDAGDGAPVVIVNQAFVDRYLSGAAPLARRVWHRGPNQPPAQIVGVVSSGRTNGLDTAAEPEIYAPLWQAQAFSKHLVVRTTSAPEPAMASVLRELREIAPTVAVESLKTLDQVRDESLASRTFAMRLLVGFAAIATVLTLVGIYSVLSLSVTARRRELAVRSAVGAERGALLRLVLREGLRLAVGGVIVGLALAVALAQVLRTLLFEVAPWDPLTLLGAGALFAGVAMVACWLPAHRASRVDPVEALKSE